MQFQKPLCLILSATAIAWPGAVLAQQKRANQHCDPIGRVLRANNKTLVGALICQGQRVQGLVQQGNAILCFVTNGISPFMDSPVNCAKSKTVKQPKMHLCVTPQGGKCYRNKGIGTAQTPRILSPYGRVIRNQRPNVTWQAVPEATSYQIQIESQSRSLWAKTVPGTSIQYPQSLPPLNPDDTYKLSVVAFKHDAPLVADSQIIQVLDMAGASAIRQHEQFIHSLKLDPDQTAYLDLNVIYLSKGLLNESIQILEERVAAGSDHPEVYRVLGDHYWAVALVDQAYAKYQRAEQLAKVQGNVAALEKAKAGLALIEKYQSQLPDSKNEDQK